MLATLQIAALLGGILLPALVVGQVAAARVTSTATLTISKVCVPVDDPGSFYLWIDKVVVKANALCGESSDPMVVKSGRHKVSETAGTAPATSLADYTRTFSGACAADGSVNLAPSSSTICIITNTRKPPQVFATLTINKVCDPDPSPDSALFDLLVDGKKMGADDVACTDGGNRSTGAFPILIGLHKVSERSDQPTILAHYLVTYGGDCASDGTITLVADDIKTCTVTNTLKPTIVLTKVCAPDPHPGWFDLRIDGKKTKPFDDVACTEFGNRTSGTVYLNPGGHTISETGDGGTVMSDYDVTYSGECDEFGAFSLVLGDAKACTVTNTLKPTLTISKVCDPVQDGGLFNLLIGLDIVGTDVACGGSAGPTKLSVGGYTVSETAGTGTDLADYDSVISGDCASDGTITLVAGQIASCTITNTLTNP
jgi:hypothetical protein